MIKVTYQETVYECSRAIKGANYIRLYDENNIQTAAFEEILDFSHFTIDGGEWETGKSTQRVTADATVDGSSFILDIKEKAIVEDGLFISFDAPASSANIKSVSINSVNYSFVDAANVVVSDIPNCFNASAKLEVVLAINENGCIAYLQNGRYNPPKDFVLWKGAAMINLDSPTIIAYATLQDLHKYSVIAINFNSYKYKDGEIVSTVFQSCLAHIRYMPEGLTAQTGIEKIYAGTIYIPGCDEVVCLEIRVYTNSTTQIGIFYSETVENPYDVHLNIKIDSIYGII